MPSVKTSAFFNIYCMVFSRKHRFVCLCCPKTGSTTIRKFLLKHCKANEWLYSDLPEAQDAVTIPHINHLPEQFADYFKFAVVRNPYRLIVSRYNFFKAKHFPNQTFEEYVEANADNTLFKKLHQNADYVPPKGHVKFKLDAFIKLENLRNELIELPFVNSVDKLLHYNYNYNASNRALFTKETIELVKEGMSDDFKNFGYSEECPKDWLAFKFM